MGRGTFHQTRLLRALSSLAVNTSKDVALEPFNTPFFLLFYPESKKSNLSLRYAPKLLNYHSFTVL